MKTCGFHRPGQSLYLTDRGIPAWCWPLTFGPHFPGGDARPRPKLFELPVVAMATVKRSTSRIPDQDRQAPAGRHWRGNSGNRPRDRSAYLAAGCAQVDPRGAPTRPVFEAAVADLPFVPFPRGWTSRPESLDLSRTSRRLRRARARHDGVERAPPPARTLLVNTRGGSMAGCPLSRADRGRFFRAPFRDDTSSLSPLTGRAAATAAAARRRHRVRGLLIRLCGSAFGHINCRPAGRAVA